jgi:hypothetical protein
VNDGDDDDPPASSFAFARDTVPLLPLLYNLSTSILLCISILARLFKDKECTSLHYVNEEIFPSNIFERNFDLILTLDGRLSHNASTTYLSITIHISLPKAALLHNINNGRRIVLTRDRHSYSAS